MYLLVWLNMKKDVPHGISFFIRSLSVLVFLRGSEETLCSTPSNLLYVFSSELMNILFFKYKCLFYFLISF